MNRFTLAPALAQYKEHGYTNREEYLKSLAIEYNANKNHVISLAELLGPAEDFNGLVSDLEDFSSFI